MIRSVLASVLVAVALSTAGACSVNAKVDVLCPDPDPPRVELTAAVLAPAPVVIVTIDGARWQDVFTSPDLMPALHAMGNERGAFVGTDGAAPIVASGPNFVSLPGYIEILSGKASESCRENDCARTTVPTILDRAASAGMRVAAFSSWYELGNALSADPGLFPISAGHDDRSYRHDAETAEVALDYLTRAQPDVFFLGLGDTDEAAHADDLPEYYRSLARADAVLGRVRAALDAMGERGRAAHVFVTTDHGRADNFRDHGEGWPESARVWLVASGPQIRLHGAVRSPHQRRLADIAPTLAVLMGISSERLHCGGDTLRELFASDSSLVE